MSFVVAHVYAPISLKQFAQTQVRAKSAWQHTEDPHLTLILGLGKIYVTRNSCYLVGLYCVPY